MTLDSIFTEFKIWTAEYQLEAVFSITYPVQKPVL